MSTPATVPMPPKVRHHLVDAVRFSPRELRHALQEVEGLNAKLAVFVTTAVGTMACAYAFCIIALTSLPATLVNAGYVPARIFPHFLVSQGLIGVISWFAQTFIQLVLLSIILVGQRVQSRQTDAQAAQQFADTKAILNLMDTKTEGGLKDILDAIAELKPSEKAA